MIGLRPTVTAVIPIDAGIITVDAAAPTAGVRPAAVRATKRLEAMRKAEPKPPTTPDATFDPDDAVGD